MYLNSILKIVLLVLNLTQLKTECYHSEQPGYLYGYMSLHITPHGLTDCL